MIGWLAVWSNHFQSGFHFDDIPTIVANGSLHQLSDVPHFFTNPRISSAEKDSASYRPLLSSWFAVDYAIGGGKPFLFQVGNWFLFALEIIMAFLLFRAVPGVNSFAAGFAALFFGLHPVTADTVNYALQRGAIVSALGVTAGMLIFIYWPWRLPQHLPVTLKRVPEHGLDEFLRNNFQRLETAYLKIIHAPVGLCLWPVAPALLCEPATAVFAPILAVWILLFETKRTLRDAIPAAVLCVSYGIFQLFFTRGLGEFRGTPAANYWFTQPWVALRFIAKFFVPVHLSVDSDLPAFAHFLDPLALAAYAGVAVLIGLAVMAARRSEWRVVSFGLWWFLIAFVPDAAVPHRAVESDWRMFLPFVGLALALAGLVSLGLEALPKGNTEEQERRTYVGLAALALALLAVMGWVTWQRNAVWSSEDALWHNAVETSPRNGRALMRYGLTQVDSVDPGAAAMALDYIRRAAAVSPDDPLIGINLAKALSRRGDSAGAEREFRRAIDEANSWSPAYSAYSEWLLAQSRNGEARAMAQKALALDAWDAVARHSIMDIMAQDHQWDRLRQFAGETLRLLPGDPDGMRSAEVAQTGQEHIVKAALSARSDPTVNKYLALSVDYFHNEKYEECIRAAQQALRISPGQAEAWANIATAYHTMGKLDETIAALQEEIRLNPDLPNAKSNLDFVLAEKTKQRDRPTSPTTPPPSTSGPNK